MTDFPMLRAQAPIVLQDGRPTPEFYGYLLGLDRALGTDYAAQFSALAARVAALEEGGALTLRGIGSITVRNGVVQLLADEDNPTGSAYYGTDMHGNRGFHPVIGAFDTRYGIEKDTPTGYNVLGTLDDRSQLPEPPSAPLDAYLIDGDYWVSDGTEWANAGPPTNIAVLGLIRGIDQDDGLLWNGTFGDYEVAPIVRNPMTTTGDLIYSSPDSTPVRLGIGAEGDVLMVASGVPVWAPNTPGEIAGQIGFGISNEGGPITAGLKRIIRITEETEITGWVLSADVAGDAVIDLWASSGYPPTISDSITGATPPTLTAQTNAAGVVADWITTIPADTWLAFVVNAGATVARLDLTLKTTRDA